MTIKSYLHASSRSTERPPLEVPTADFDELDIPDQEKSVKPDYSSRGRQL